MYFVIMSANLLCVCVCVCTDAAPTHSEKEVYDVVSGVLDNTPEILEELENYPGANQEIRQVLSMSPLHNPLYTVVQLTKKEWEKRVSSPSILTSILPTCAKQGV